MKKDNIVKILLAVFIVLFSVNNYAQEHGVEHVDNEDTAVHEVPGKIDTKEEVTEYIDHHLQDSHYFNFFSDGSIGAHSVLQLPVFICVGGLKMFSASKVHHGEDLASIDGQECKLYHLSLKHM